MDTSGPTDVVVSVPARPEFMQLLRAAVGSVAARVDFTYEAIDDLRIAVDEACARILAVPGTPGTLFLRIIPEEYSELTQSTPSIGSKRRWGLGR